MDHADACGSRTCEREVGKSLLTDRYLGRVRCVVTRKDPYKSGFASTVLAEESKD
jgi:hypothetical protein